MKNQNHGGTEPVGNPGCKCGTVISLPALSYSFPFVWLSCIKSWDHEERIREAGRMEGRAEERQKAQLKKQQMGSGLLRLQAEIAHYKEELK